MIYSYDPIFARLAAQPRPWGSVIACFFTGTDFPDACTAMPRDPEPPIGQRFGEDFASVYASAIGQNAAIHDGAVMLGRSNTGADYIVRGWSYRLFPPFEEQPIVNRGSAFNSCLAMSFVNGVDGLFLVSNQESYRFVAGAIAKIGPEK